MALFGGSAAWKRMSHRVVSTFIMGLLLSPTLASTAERPQGSTLTPQIFLAQAGSAGGTIGKQDKSLSGEERAEPPRRAPAQKPRAASGPAKEAEPSRSADSRCRNIAGAWTWTSSLPTVGIALKSDGRAEATNGSIGRWSCAGGIFTVTWQNGVVDRLVVSETGTTMSGTSGFLGVTITATKI